MAALDEEGPGNAQREAAADGIDRDTILSVATPERAVRVIAGLIGDTRGRGRMPHPAGLT